jgi:hypothetical protein
MSYATYYYADILSENIRALRSKEAVESLLRISEPLLDSTENIKEKLKHAPLYELMLLTAAIHLYEQGKKEFYFPDLVHTVTVEMTSRNIFHIYSDLCSNFDYLVKSGTFVQASTGRKKYMLTETVRGKLDRVAQTHLDVTQHYTLDSWKN